MRQPMDERIEFHVAKVGVVYLEQAVEGRERLLGRCVGQSLQANGIVAAAVTAAVFSQALNRRQSGTRQPIQRDRCALAVDAAVTRERLRECGGIAGRFQMRAQSRIDQT